MKGRWSIWLIVKAAIKVACDNPFFLSYQNASKKGMDAHHWYIYYYYSFAHHKTPHYSTVPSQEDKK